MLIRNLGRKKRERETIWNPKSHLVTLVILMINPGSSLAISQVVKIIKPNSRQYSPMRSPQGQLSAKDGSNLYYQYSCLWLCIKTLIENQLRWRPWHSFVYFSWRRKTTLQNPVGQKYIMQRLRQLSCIWPTWVWAPALHMVSWALLAVTREHSNSLSPKYCQCDKKKIILKTSKEKCVLPPTTHLITNLQHAALKNCLHWFIGIFLNPGV